MPKRKVGTESSECPATLVIMIMNDDVDENDGELGRFWTKIQSDDCFETVSTPGLLLDVFFPPSVTFVLDFTELQSPMGLALYFQVDLSPKR